MELDSESNSTESNADSKTSKKSKEILRNEKIQNLSSIESVQFLTDSRTQDLGCAEV
ncbi:hypothetical protein [uncultured Helicobacter sp.]|uniref:hypothetical protein n=1 Tax=uncultured Helicobacter sp. TaxID=175537 RepID=UPI003750F66F